MRQGWAGLGRWLAPILEEPMMSPVPTPPLHKIRDQVGILETVHGPCTDLKVDPYMTQVRVSEKSQEVDTYMTHVRVSERSQEDEPYVTHVGPEGASKWSRT